ncbi:hypothetical protein ACS0TY_012350 [Phlomoides rotata]
MMYDQYLDTVEIHDPLKSELDVYLEEGFFRGQDGEVSVEEFDALVWWRSQELKFNVLSKLARDVLAIPISIVASEATFSAGTRVLDLYRSRLTPDMVQVLVCGADWVRQFHGIKKIHIIFVCKKSFLAIPIILLIIPLKNSSQTNEPHHPTHQPTTPPHLLYYDF